VIIGTLQQLGDDSGPVEEMLGGFVGLDRVIGPILAYDTQLAGNAPLSFSLRRVPTIASRNRLSSESTVMGTVTLIF
jgi:hypothetical protein